MLAGRGFVHVYNLSGGIKGWRREVAVGNKEVGLYLFPPEQSLEDTIIAGFGLEEGLRDFYLQMQSRVKDDGAKDLLKKLAAIEIIHQEWLVDLYSQVTNTKNTIGEFLKKIAEPVMEGGLSTDEYLQLYDTDLDSELEILSLAMAIEAQALDLYQRAAAVSMDPEVEKVLRHIAGEERRHMVRLSEYIDTRQDLL